MAAKARRYRLAVFTKNRKNPAYVGARLGADRVAARHGCVVTHYVPETPDDVDEQHALLEAAYAERPDAVLIAPAHATALNGTLRRMQADGIPILCFVSRPRRSPALASWGRTTGRWRAGSPTICSTASTGAATSSRWRAILLPSRRPRARRAFVMRRVRARASGSWTRVRAISCATADTRE